jgi:hypothetical protein
VEALRQLRRFERMLRDELGIASSGLADLIPVNARHAVSPIRAPRGSQAPFGGAS